MYDHVWLCDDNELIDEHRGSVIDVDPTVRRSPYFTFRVIDMVSGEPVEPGASGRVVIPHDGQYRIETRHRDGLRGRDFYRVLGA